MELVLSEGKKTGRGLHGCGLTPVLLTPSPQLPTFCSAGLDNCQHNDMVKHVHMHTHTHPPPPHHTHTTADTYSAVLNNCQRKQRYDHACKHEQPHTHAHTHTHPYTPASWTMHSVTIDTSKCKHTHMHAHTYTHLHTRCQAEGLITQAQRVRSAISHPHPFLLVKLWWSYPPFFWRGFWTSISSWNRFEGWNGFDVRIFLLGRYLISNV